MASDGVRYTGTIIRIVGDRGFGFCTTPDGDCFLHASDLSGVEWSEALMERRVSFEIKTAENGKQRAVRATLIDCTSAELTPAGPVVNWRRRILCLQLPRLLNGGLSGDAVFSCAFEQTSGTSITELDYCAYRQKL
jgi:cold shock CspA family protein